MERTRWTSRGSWPRALALGVGLTTVAGASQAQIYTRRSASGVVEATNVPDSSEYRLTYPGKGVVIHSRAYRLRPSYNGEFDHHISAAAAAHGVSVDLVRAVIQVESDFDRQAVSSKGAQGLMQLMPFTARRFGVSDPFDPRQNVFGGVRFLRFLLDLFQGNVALAVAGYNAGENAVLRSGGIPPYKETRAYVDKVQSLLGSFPPPVASTTQALFLTSSLGPLAPPLPPVAAVSRQASASRALRPARPKVYYRWHDASGVLHVAQSPPAEGVLFSMIRALD